MRVRYKFFVFFTVLLVFSSNLFAQWEPLENEWENYIRDISIENNYLFVTTSDFIQQNNQLFLSTDNGDTFNNISQNLPDSVNSAKVDDITYHKGNIYLVIEKDLFRTPDLGTTWYEIETSFSETGFPFSIMVEVISIESNGENLYAGTYGRGGALLVSKDDGEQWEYINEINFPNSEIDQIEATDSYIYYKVNNSAIYRSDNAMGDWINIYSDSNIRDFDVNMKGDSVAISLPDSLYLSTDSGVNFNASEEIKGSYIYNSAYANGTFFVKVAPNIFNPTEIGGGVFYSNSSTNNEWMSLSGEQYLEYSRDMVANDQYVFIQYNDTLITRTHLSNFGVTTNAEQPEEILPNYILNQNYPNPFNPSTTISYSIPEQSNVSLKVYDVLGKEVAELINSEKPAGSYEVNFDASSLSSGIYFYTLNAGNFSETRKMLLIK